MTQIAERAQGSPAPTILVSDSDEEISRDLFDGDAPSNKNDNVDVARPEEIQQVENDNFFGTVQRHDLYRPNFLQNKNDSKSM